MRYFFNMAKGQKGRRGPPERKWARPPRLKEWRDYRDKTVEGLADEAGVSPGLISQIENRLSNGSPASLQKLATALGCTVGELFDPPSPGTRRLEIMVPEAEYDRVMAIVQAAIGHRR